MAIQGFGRDQVLLLAGRGFDLPTFEVATGAVFLNTANWPRKAGAGVTVGCFVNGERISRVFEGRAGARQGIDH